jgi:glutathione S-transferase
MNRPAHRSVGWPMHRCSSHAVAGPLRRVAAAVSFVARGTLHPPCGQGLALNPHALVPVLIDGPLVLSESNAICRYLAAKHGRTDLLPADPAGRARVEQCMDWQATELNNAWRYAFMALVRQSAAHADAAACAASVAQWNAQMQLLDAQLARSGAYAAGAAFTLADVVLGLSTHRWLMTPMQRPDLPAVQAYYERLSERPAFLLHGRNGLP